MTDIQRTVYLAFMCLVCALLGAGCDRPKPPTAASRGPSSAILDQVRQLAAEQLNVEPSRLDATTSLAELGADELDFVELVMELEDHFDITISEPAAQEMMGTDDFAQGLRNVTLEKLASFIEQAQQRSAGSSGKNGADGVPSVQAATEHAQGRAPALGKALPPKHARVRVFINNRKYGESNGCTATSTPQASGGDARIKQSLECGHAGAASKLTWQYLRSDAEGDHYQFERLFPLGEPEQQTTSKTVVYQGGELVIFEDDVQRVLLLPGEEE